MGSNPAGKISAIVAGTLTGADCIDDLDVIRHGGMPARFGECYAPSTLGSFLREFTFGHVRQLGAAARRFLINLAKETPLLPGAEAVTYVDVNSLLRRVYGKAKQGVGFGHTKVGGYGVLLRGLSSLVATLSTPLAAPVIAAARRVGGLCARRRVAGPSPAGGCGGAGAARRLRLTTRVVCGSEPGVLRLRPRRCFWRGKIDMIVAGMVGGADSIADLDALRHGGMSELFGQVYALSTLGRSCASSPSVMSASSALRRAGC